MYVRFRDLHKMDPRRIDKTSLGSRLVFATLCVHIYDRSSNDSLDNDSRTLPQRNPRHCTFHLFFNGQSVNVLCHSKFQVMKFENFDCFFVCTKTKQNTELFLFSTEVCQTSWAVRMPSSYSSPVFRSLGSSSLYCSCQRHTTND